LDEGHREALEALAMPLRDAGVPPDLAQWVAGFDTLSCALDLVEVAETCDVKVAQAAQVYFGLGAALQLDWLVHRTTALPNQERWVVPTRYWHRLPDGRIQ